MYAILIQPFSDIILLATQSKIRKINTYMWVELVGLRYFSRSTKPCARHCLEFSSIYIKFELVLFHSNFYKERSEKKKQRVSITFRKGLSLQIC